MRRRSPQATDVASGPTAATKIDSLRRGLDLLRQLDAGDSALLAREMAERANLPEATTLRLLRTLVAGGFLREVAGGERFEPDVGCLTLGHSMLTSLVVVSALGPHLQATAQKLRLDSVLVSLDGTQAIVLRHEGDSLRRLADLDAGAQLPLARSASGRALLWSLPGGLQSQIFAVLRKEFATNLAGIYRGFQEIEERGWCSSSDGLTGVAAIAAPIPVPGDHPPLAVALKTRGTIAPEAANSLLELVDEAKRYLREAG